MASFAMEVSAFIVQQLTWLYGNYNLVAVVTVLTFDIVETFPHEVSYIWKKEFGIFGLLYVFVRYVPFILHLIFLAGYSSIFIPPLNEDLAYCIPWFAVLGCTEYLFIMRAVALNGNSRWLRYALIALFVGEMMTGFIFYLVSLHPVSQAIIDKVVIELVPQTPGILYQKVPQIVAFGLPETVFQSILVLVIICTIIRHRKTWTLLGEKRERRLMTIIVRDGLWGYFLNLFGLLVIITEPSWLPGPSAEPSLQWSYVTFSITSSRLLLNIRSSSEGRGTLSDNYSSSF